MIPDRCRRLSDVLVALAVAGVAVGAAATLHRTGPLDVDAGIERVVDIPYNAVGRLLDVCIGLSPVVIVLAALGVAIGCWRRGRRWSAIAVVASPSAVMGAVEVLKPLVGRLGPSGQVGAYYYPSGHEALASSVCTIAVLAIRPTYPAVSGRRRLAIAGVLAAACVLLGLGLVGLRWHYPTDVLAGAALGVAGALVAARVTDRCAAGQPRPGALRFRTGQPTGGQRS